MVFSWKGFGVDPERDLGSVGAKIWNNFSSPTFFIFYQIFKPFSDYEIFISRTI